MSETIVIDGAEYHLGCIPTSPLLRASVPLLETKIPLIPRAEWQDTGDRRHLVPRIMFQNGNGSCASEGGCEDLEIARCIAGQPHVKLSPGNLYGRVNGGGDNGSTLGDNLIQLQKYGVCTEALVPHLDWRGWNKPGWKEEAKSFRILEFFYCPSFEHLATAADKGFALLYGITVNDNFKVGPGGWVNEYRRMTREGGHGMCGFGLRERRGKWGIDTANSWGTGWGDGGFGIVPQSYFRGGYNDAWCVRSVTRDSEET